MDTLMVWRNDDRGRILGTYLGTDVAPDGTPLVVVRTGPSAYEVSHYAAQCVVIGRL